MKRIPVMNRFIFVCLEIACSHTTGHFLQYPGCETDHDCGEGGSNEILVLCWLALIVNTIDIP